MVYVHILASLSNGLCRMFSHVHISSSVELNAVVSWWITFSLILHYIISICSLHHQYMFILAVASYFTRFSTIFSRSTRVFHYDSRSPPMAGSLLSWVVTGRWVRSSGMEFIYPWLRLNLREEGWNSPGVFSLQVRVFHFLTGKLHRVFDESLSFFTEQQQVL